MIRLGDSPWELSGSGNLLLLRCAGDSITIPLFYCTFLDTGPLMNCSETVAWRWRCLWRVKQQKKALRRVRDIVSWAVYETGLWIGGPLLLFVFLVMLMKTIQ